MKIHRSKHLAMLATVIFFTMGLAVISFPIPIISECFILLAFAWFWYEQCQQHVLLKKSSSICKLECDEHQRWTLQANNQDIIFAKLTKKSVATAHWMCLYFVGISHHKNFRVLLSSDSVSKKDWSILQMFVHFAKPIKAVSIEQIKENK
jgi:hypothetical protein